MSSQFSEMSSSEQRNILVHAATRALIEQGSEPERIPGRGRASNWIIKRNGGQTRVTIRTTTDRWIAFPPLEGGKKWKTLSDVDLVVVAAVDETNNPKMAEVYQFDADELRMRFDQSYAARTLAGHTIQDNFGMWVGLDRYNSDSPIYVGSGLVDMCQRKDNYEISELISEVSLEAEGNSDGSDLMPESESGGQEPHTIAEVMDWARRRIAVLSGTRMEAVKLDCHIET